MDVSSVEYTWLPWFKVYSCLSWTVYHHYHHIIITSPSLSIHAEGSSSPGQGVQGRTVLGGSATHLLPPSVSMTALLANLSLPGTLLGLTKTDSTPNLTGPVQLPQTVGRGELGGSLAPLCTFCCCGLLNRTLAVVFMVSLAFAIVVGNVVTLTVFMQTRQSRTPQGYLKGTFGSETWWSWW